MWSPHHAARPWGSQNCNQSLNPPISLCCPQALGATSWDKFGISLQAGLAAGGSLFSAKVWGMPTCCDSGTLGPLLRFHTTQLSHVVTPLCLVFTFQRVPMMAHVSCPEWGQVVLHKRICRRMKVAPLNIENVFILAIRARAVCDAVPPLPCLCKQSAGTRYTSPPSNEWEHATAQEMSPRCLSLPRLSHWT